ncbi:MAG: hypothetical protein WCW63_03150 [Acholeplasmataceae bacterium]
MTNEQIKYIKVIKTCPGNLTITIVNPLTRVSQRLRFRSDQKEQFLPIEWASYVYTDTAGGAYKMFRNGYFTFDDVESVKEYAASHGWLMGDVDFEPINANYEAEILTALKGGKKSLIEVYFKDTKKQEDLTRVARDNIGELTQGVIKLIEDTLKVTLRVDGE